MKMYKKPLRERVEAKVELGDIQYVMRALARDYFLAITYITGDPSYKNFYQRRVYPLEKKKGHYMDMIELVTHYVDMAIFPPGYEEGTWEEITRAEKRVRSGEKTLYRIIVEPLAHVVDTMKDCEPSADSHHETSK